MKQWLRKWLGINPDLEQERYIATQAQLAQITKGLDMLAEINSKLTDSTEKLAGQVKLNSDEISGIKEAIEYHTKEIWLIKKQLEPAKAKASTAKPASKK